MRGPRRGGTLKSSGCTFSFIHRNDISADVLACPELEVDQAVVSSRTARSARPRPESARWWPRPGFLTMPMQAFW